MNRDDVLPAFFALLFATLLLVVCYYANKPYERDAAARLACIQQASGTWIKIGDSYTCWRGSLPR